MPVSWWMRLDLVFLVGRTASGGVFCGVCDLILILGSLSANGWGVPVLLVVWHRVFTTVACWLLSGDGWVLALKWRSLRELSPFDTTLELESLWWTNVLNSALPPQKHRPDTWLEHQDPVSHTVQKKREKKERKKNNNNKIKIINNKKM